jgi:hypothetical protein
MYPDSGYEISREDFFMNTQRPTLQTDRMENTSALLPLLWIFLSLNYLLCDLLSNMEAATLRGLLASNAGGFPVTEGFLLFAGITLEIPMMMALLCCVLPPKVNKVVNVCVAALMIVYQLGSFMVGSGTTLHYAFFSAIEILGNAAVIALVLRRKKG